MKKRIGGILIVSGAILLLNPTLDVQQLMAGMETMLVSYWPVLLIVLGLALQNDGRKKMCIRDRKRTVDSAEMQREQGCGLAASAQRRFFSQRTGAACVR